MVRTCTATAEGIACEPDPAPNYCLSAAPTWDPSQVIDLILQEDQTNNLNLRDTVRMCTYDPSSMPNEAVIPTQPCDEQQAIYDEPNITIEPSIPIHPDATLHELQPTQSKYFKPKEATTRIMRQAMSSN